MLKPWWKIQCGNIWLLFITSKCLQVYLKQLILLRKRQSFLVIILNIPKKKLQIEEENNNEREKKETSEFKSESVEMIDWPLIIEE